MAYLNPNLLNTTYANFETTDPYPWVAGSNTTIATSTTVALTGTRSLRLTATAAGTVVVRNPDRVDVGSYPEYVAFCPVGLSATKAGLTAQIKVYCYSASSGGSLINTYTSASFPISSSAGFNGDYPALIVPDQPSGTYAEYEVLVSGMAAAGTVYIDNPYIGRTYRRGEGTNLLSYGASSFEDGLNGWTASNATATRSNAMLPPNGGYYSLRLSATAAGSMPAVSPSIPVTAGTDYIANLWAWTPTTAVASCPMTIRWFDASSALISESTTAGTLPANTVTYLTTWGTAPVGAVTARVVVAPVAASAGHLVYVDEVLFRVPVNFAGNLLPWQEYGAEAGPASWESDATLTWQGSGTSIIDKDYYSTKVEFPAGAVTDVTMAYPVSVTAGETYRFKCDASAYIPAGTTVTFASCVFATWFDAEGTPIKITENVEITPRSQSIPGGGYYKFQFVNTDAAPVNATTMTFTLRYDGRELGAAPEFWIDNASVVTSEPLVTVEVDNDLGVVKVGCAVDGSGTVYVSLTRIDADGSEHFVRGYGNVMDHAPMAGGSWLYVEDYEAPLGTRIWYRCIRYNTATSTSGSILAATNTVDSPVLPDGDHVWLKSPGLPALNTKVVVESPLSWSRKARTASFDIVGRRNPIVITGARGGRTGSVSLLVLDTESNFALDKLLDKGLPVLVQAMPGYGVESNLYLSINDVDVEPLTGNARDEGWRWTLDVDEIDRPDGGIQGSATRTWDDIETAFATWDEMFSAYPSFVEVLTG